jgi:hypothetical protein
MQHNCIPHSDNQIILSFCFTGRNDKYLGNFLYRLSTTLNFLARSVQQAGLVGQVEAVVTDWNSENSLAEALMLNTNAAEITRFLRVTPEIAKYHNRAGQVFNGSVAANTAIRRANGVYLCALPADILITETALFNLAQILKGRVISFPHHPMQCYFKLSRRMIPAQVVNLEPTIDEWHEILRSASCKFEEVSQPEISAATGGLLTSSVIWHESKGVDEKMTGWGCSDIELGLRIETVYPGIETSFYGVVVYDMDQDSNERAANQASNTNSMRYRLKIGLDDAENWGLRDYNIVEEKNSGFDSFMRNREEVSATNYDGLFSGFDVSVLHQEMQFKLPYLKEIDRSGLDSYLLYWFATRAKCLDYLEFGVGESFPSAALVVANPAVSLTYVNAWKNSYEDSELLWSPAKIAATLRIICKHRGLVRFLNGPLKTAAERLPKVIGRECIFDVIYVDIGYADVRALDFKIFFSWIRNDGMLLFKIGENKNLIEYLLNENSSRWRSLTFPSHDAIIFFNTGYRSLDVGLVGASICQDRYFSFRPSRLARALEYMALMCSKGFAMCYYVPIWQWPTVIIRKSLQRFIGKYKSL